MFFKRNNDSLFLKKVKKLFKIIERFIPVDEVDSITQYVIGPIVDSNYSDLKSFLLTHQPLNPFDIYINDFITIYKVTSRLNRNLIFASRNSEEYKETIGFYSSVEDLSTVTYLRGLDYFVLYKNGMVYTSGNDIVNKEYIPISSEKVILKKH